MVFLRKTETDDETLLIVCNFTPVVRNDYKIGVPFKGKYKEIFNSDALVYGGSGNVNPRLKQSKFSECDGKDESIRITVPPLGMSVFSCTRLREAKKPVGSKTSTVESKREKTPVKKVSKRTTRKAK